MVQIASGQNAVDAWKNAAKLIIKSPKRRIRNLVVEIENQQFFSRAWLKKFDPKSVGSDDSLSVVAKVLFPYSGKKPNETREHFYERWNNSLKRNKRRKKLRAPWGTYFGRLTDFGGQVNQLENLIKALSSWRIKPEAALVAHLSAPTLDQI